MAWPSDLVRTKNWGSEVLTDADLEGQLDLIINWVMATMDSTTGHGHTATANDSQKISAATGFKIASQAQGDILYASSASAFARLGAGTKGQALTTGGAAANPAWAGMTTQGDVEYHDGTSRARLAAGTSGKFLKTQGAGANPMWDTVPTPTVFNYSGASVYNAASPGAYTDLDLSATVGANRCMVFLKVTCLASTQTYGFRTNGETADPGALGTAEIGGGCNLLRLNVNSIGYIWMMTDASGIVEWKSHENSGNTTQIHLMGYIK